MIRTGKPFVDFHMDFFVLRILCLYWCTYVGSLISSDVSYEVPRFLACITTEAMVSSGDIQILQKSRIQRQNQSYNLSR